MLETSQVLLFVKSVNALDRESVGPLLETEEGLMDDWAVIKGVCSRFGKWREWRDKGLLTAGGTVGRKLEEPTLAETEETRRWINYSAVQTDVVKGPFGGTALEELTKMVWDL